MKYTLAEKFKSLQGEGVYAGTPMAFIRFTGCSVGKTICSFCDTDFERPVLWRGGGEFTAEELVRWASPYTHLCLTGGEPLDQDLEPLMTEARKRALTVHVETSGTKPLAQILHPLNPTWICVSPKPGYIEPVVLSASEIKVIMPGLGKLQYGTPILSAEPHGLRWPTLEDALRWAGYGKIVFLQPKNDRYDIDAGNLRLCQDIIAEYPQLRLSVQLHKVLKVQ